MNWTGIILLTGAVTSTLLAQALGSFSRIGLTGFLESLPESRRPRLDPVAHFDDLLYSLEGSSALWSAACLLWAHHSLAPFPAEPLLRILGLLTAYLLLFQMLLVWLGTAFREPIVGRLHRLFPLHLLFFSPINRVRNRFSEEREHDAVSTEDPSEKELEVFFEEGTRDGVLGHEDKDMIVSVIEFGDTLVKEVMTPRVDMVTLDIQDDTETTLSRIRDTKKSRYPVIRGRIDQICGILLSKDVLEHLGCGSPTDLTTLLREAFYVPETMRILELLKQFQRTRQKMAIVVDEFGGVSGLITMEDIVEELVGDIQDEYDSGEAPVINSGSHLLVLGDTDVSTLQEYVEPELPDEEDYQTVAGLIAFHLGKIPNPGDTLNIAGLTFTVLEMDNKRIRKVQIDTDTPSHP